MALDTKVTTEGESSGSPISVLADETENGDTSIVSRTMEEVERELMESREKEEASQNVEAGDSPQLDETRFSKLDHLLTTAQLYAEFLQEKMNDVALNVLEEQPTGTQEPTKRGRSSKRRRTAECETNGVDELACETHGSKKKGRSSKRKAAARYDSRKAERAVEAMLARSKEGAAFQDLNLTEEEKAEKEQADLVPLLTGGKLKSYQVKGVKWLISLWQNGLNGILADQMGLGKTIQTVAFLAHLKGMGLHGPYLIVAPLSTLSNWVNEIRRFTPSLNAIVYHGSKDERAQLRRQYMPTKKDIDSEFPMVVTSYEIAMSDAKSCLSKYQWKYLVVDEGHRLKNFKCKLVKDLKYISVENKLLLTGTPLQNNLAELWSLLNFLLPDIFASLTEFESWFDLSGKYSSETFKEEMVEKRKAQVVTKLHAILRPFLLRRMKADVELTLPGKKEIILYATMTEHQQNLQNHLLNKTLENYLNEKDTTGRGMRGKLNNLMIQLRKNCYHPDLLESAVDGSPFYPPVEEIVGKCGKFFLLDRLITMLFERKHKVLIFSQWTKVLDIMHYYFIEKGFKVCRIDGSVKLDERRLQIQEFNDVNSDYRIFLLSTRAGGLGINLTAADTCILYDSDWNPQMDLQAMDRCHRIGQTKPVHVYRLATAQSIEGRILKRAFSKLKLEHVVIGKGQFKQEGPKPSGLDDLEEEELLALLRNEEDAEDKMIQRDISDEDLERLLDRSDLMQHGDGATLESFPLKGPGWQVVVPTSAGGMLSSLNT